ncbi:MFS transporter [Streptacidiphilus jiangxiensis]|uniref:MFS transporter, CP family, cyanate transporter n=1 Tax=Streptacidiphilus jiangxiensis TaxID=235985 RepID=A0A1H7VK19_STRJI|nr:MFS transporter [Streptacidiphilus jiangxiensis]SEM09621.1 MFS transporter, CP family, cyanate transporter [Streptacidiphilus jiangxiensis]
MPAESSTTAVPSTAAEKSRTSTAPTRAAKVRARWLLALALAVAAFNLRPAVAALGPQLDHVRSTLHMNAGVAGLLTALPSLCFALVGFAAPRLARRLGPAITVCLGMGAITLGIAARSFAPGSAVFLLLSALALAGIAVSNVLMPVLVKRYFPDKIGPITGLYSMSLALGTSVAAAVAVPLTTALGGGWRVGLGVWALAGALALVLWLVQAAVLGRDGAGSTSSAATRIRISRSPTAWLLGVFFGLQATAAYATMGWLPQIFKDAGISATESGVLLAVTMAVGAPLAFVIPPLAARLPHQGPVAAALAACGLGAYAGLAFAPAAAPYAWALLLGVANCAFPLVLTMIGLRSRTSEGVAALSAFVQGVGYLISVPGPVLIGVLYQREHGWAGPLALLAGLMTVQLVLGLRAGRPRQIEDEV